MRNVNDNSLGVITAVCLKYSVGLACSLKLDNNELFVQTEEVALLSCQQMNIMLVSLLNEVRFIYCDIKLLIQHKIPPVTTFKAKTDSLSVSPNILNIKY